MAVAAFPFRRDTASIGAAAQFLDNLPSAVMLCEPQNLVICYLNKASVQLLKSIEHVLPVKADQVLGSSIDIFHKNPSHQRRLLADPKNLPHTARIKAGDEILELNINAVRDARGAYAYVQLTWSVITKAVEHEEKTERLLQMIEEMPINVMTCTLDDFRIDFANRASRETLKRIEQYLPVKAADLIGTSIDVFHKAPAHQRRMLADPSNLPHQANIKVGPETLRLRVSAIKDQKGNYVGPMVTWAVVTESVALANSVNEVVGSMTDTSAEMQQSSSRLLELTQSSDQTAAAVSAAAVEMSASFDEISSQIRQATGMSQDVAERARSTDQLVSGLTESVERIGAFTAQDRKSVV